MNTKLKLTFLALLISGTVATSIAEAQRPERGTRGRGGMRGGAGMGGQISAIALVGQEPVQKELALKEDQVDKLKSLREDYQDEMRESAGGGFAALRDLPEAERETKRKELFAKAAESGKKLNEKYQTKLAEILDKPQQERLQQIKWQVAGAQALNDPELVKLLALTKEQQDKLTAIREESSKKMAAMVRTRGEGGQEEFAAKRAEITKERDKQINEVLTPEQQKKFTDAKGKAFDTASLRMGTGGGERRPGGRGRRGPAKEADKKDAA